MMFDYQEYYFRGEKGIIIDYLFHLFSAVLENRHEEWAVEEIEYFRRLDVVREKLRQSELSAEDQRFYYELAFRLFAEYNDYRRVVELSVLPSFYQLSLMSLDEVAHLFPREYTKMYYFVSSRTE